MFLFVLSSEPLTPFYFVFLFIGVLRRVSVHTLAPHLLKLQKYSTMSSSELPVLVLLFLKVGSPPKISASYLFRLYKYACSLLRN